MRIVRRKKQEIDSLSGYLIANAMGMPDLRYTGPDTEFRVSDENIRSAGIKMSVERSDPKDIIEQFEVWSELVYDDQDFIAGYKAALQGKPSDWKIVAFEPQYYGLALHFASEKRYDEYLANERRDEELLVKDEQLWNHLHRTSTYNTAFSSPEYDGQVALYFKKCCYARMEFEVLEKAGLKKYAVDISGMSHFVSIATEEGNKEEIATIFPEKDNDDPSRIRMFMQETEIYW